MEQSPLFAATCGIIGFKPARASSGTLARAGGRARNRLLCPTCMAESRRHAAMARLEPGAGLELPSNRKGRDKVSTIPGSSMLITGAASGLGRQIALKTARRGCRAILWDVNELGLERVLDEIKAERTGQARGYCCDVSDRTAVYETAARVRSEAGEIDILVNNAGIVSGSRFQDIPDEKLEATLRVNTLAHFWTCKAFLPSMIERNRGHLVTIASSAGLVGIPGLTDYCASKWAAVGFTESLRMELRKSAPGVKTTLVCPWIIDTGMFKGIRSPFPRLLPALREDKAANRVLEAIESNQPWLILPATLKILLILHALPVSILDGITNIMGVHAIMDDFVGR